LLQLAFSTQALRDVCENEERAVRELGRECANALKARLADIRAAENVSDLVAGHPRRVPSSKDQLMLDLAKGCTAVLAVNHATIPRLASGVVDWANVSRIKLLRIEKHNG
jgi:hypothetical protein